MLHIAKCGERDEKGEKQDRYLLLNTVHRTTATPHELTYKHIRLFEATRVGLFAGDAHGRLLAKTFASSSRGTLPRAPRSGAERPEATGERDWGPAKAALEALGCDDVVALQEGISELYELGFDDLAE